MSKKRRRVHWKDLEIGEKRENEAIEKLKQTLGLTTLEKLGRFCPFDFKSDKGYVEYRTRSCNYDKYPTTMIPYKKIAFSNSVNDPCHIVIQFKDKLAHWRVPDNFTCTTSIGGRCDRGYNEFSLGKQYYYLDIYEMDILSSPEKTGFCADE